SCSHARSFVEAGCRCGLSHGQKPDERRGWRRIGGKEPWRKRNYNCERRQSFISIHQQGSRLPNALVAAESTGPAGSLVSATRPGIANSFVVGDQFYPGGHVGTQPLSVPERLFAFMGGHSGRQRFEGAAVSASSSFAAALLQPGKHGRFNDTH